jgi:hypothetical protein
MALEYEPAGQMEHALSVWVEHFDIIKEPGGQVAMLLHLEHILSVVALHTDDT